MITPRFSVEQTENNVTFIIHAPYASIAEAEVYADEDIFCFFASPYYLRIHLPGHIEETDVSKASYDADKGIFTICVQKVTSGQHFPDLDLLTALLTPRKNNKATVSQPLIEVLDESAEINSDSDDEWYFHQNPVEEQPEEFFLTAPRYGFGNKTSGAFINFKTEFLEVIELPDPDKTPIHQRAKLRFNLESEEFSDDHYLADWVQPEVIDSFLKYTPSVCLEESNFSDEEKDVMKDLPKKEFLLDKEEKMAAYLSLVDILLAYAYNNRTTLGENTVESGWTINKLSATLSWLQTFHSVPEVVNTFIRRSLCYPLYRHWDLSKKVVKDVVAILKLGQKQILKCLLEIYLLFNNSEPRYLLNQLYIKDYCIWIQQCSKQRLHSLCAALDEFEPNKRDVQLDLEELEIAALSIQKEEDEDKQNEAKTSTEVDVGNVSAGLAQLQLASDAGKSSKTISNTEPNGEEKFSPKTKISEILSSSEEYTEDSEESSDESSSDSESSSSN